MITQRLHFMENGNEKTMIIRYRIKDFKNSFIFKKLGIDDPRWYVEYNRYDKSSLFDSSAPTWYVRLAAIFENIYWDHDYVGIVRHESITEEYYRADIERYVYGIAEKFAPSYKKARIEFYEMTLKLGLNPGQSESYKLAINCLKSL